ncbi:uncharacterized protein LOC123517120 [Portunus trituberculatus]|uniref:uncharacterized protein LOC123517120 n=1 Tax=Portunus trituberculatus TaxID=210409 RepID=UPI001E1CE754|nr:uncharacterized protein LOC123517120 [Portunus trituberculatus]
MWSKHLSLMQVILLTLITTSWIVQSSSYVAAEFCKEDLSEEEEIAFTCSCHFKNETIIIQDLKISSGGKHLILPTNTTRLQVGWCQAVHLNGPTLISLSNIHILHLHEIDVLHVSYDFFLQYQTQLQTLQLSSSGFAPLHDALIIHAHKLTRILFDNIISEREFSLLLQTDQNQHQEILAITNSKIKTLGEINIASRYVKKIVLQSNMIGKVLTSALLHDSQDTVIENNSIDSLEFLSFDFNTHNFTFKQNIIKSLAMYSLVINEANAIIMLHNTFYHIERHGLAWLHLTQEHGYFLFSGNHFYAQEEESLILPNFMPLNYKLEIEDNVLHTVTCNCSTMILLNSIITDSTMREPQVIYELFEHSTICSDMKNNTIRLNIICGKNSVDKEPVIYYFITGGIIIGSLLIILLLLKVKKYAKITNVTLATKEMEIMLKSPG